MAVGQRYEIIVDANQETGNYWMRAVPQQTCLTINKSAFNIQGIIRYDSTSTADPTTSSSISLDQCTDEAASNLVPVISQTVGSAAEQDNFSISLLPNLQDSLEFQWVVNTDRYNPNTQRPTLSLIQENASTTYPSNYSVTAIDTEGEVSLIDPIILVPANAQCSGYTMLFRVFFLLLTLSIFTVTSQSILPPRLEFLHLLLTNFNSFYVLAAGTGIYANLSILPILDTSNPVRRDVALLPQTGYLVIGFKTDNPGAWLMVRPIFSMPCRKSSLTRGSISTAILPGTSTQDLPCNW
jgi:hypothetical protein